MKRLIAVREIAYFLYSSGDLSVDFFSNSSKKDGKKAHQYLQNKYKNIDEKEYYIKKIIKYRDDEITIHGFIDGVINEDSTIILEEIKSTKLNLKLIEIDYHKEHLAQLMLYAYMYSEINDLEEVNVRLTYINITDYKTKSFPITYKIEELKSFFYESIDKYIDWLEIIEEKSKLKLTTIKDIKFPFNNMREGQFDLIKGSYYTLTHNELLYVIAPTGIGKTIATLFAGIKSLNDNKKLFYLTSKNMQKKICIESINLLKLNGLKLKTIVITSKSKSCLNSSKVCDASVCPYAKGFFNRLREAFLEIYNEYDIFTYEIINHIALKYQICSFEFSLYISYFCDVIICDYNYVFDPKAHLIRYFDDDSYKPLILIDEAHNLISRSKDMFSSKLLYSTISKITDLLIDYDKYIYKFSDDIFDQLKSIESNMIDNIYYNKLLNDDLVYALNRYQTKVETILEEIEDMKNRPEVLMLYFELKDIIDIIDIYSDSHIFIVTKKLEDYEIEIVCLDASRYINKVLTEKCYGTVLFSATLYPIKYHMDLLTEGNGRFMTLNSPFDSSNFNLILNTKISTKYKDRENTIKDIVNIVDILVTVKKGNHIVFFPSYKYMELFLEHINPSDYNLLIQSPSMTDIEKTIMFESFKDSSKNHLGLFVLGGSFSEGIDFKDDLLNGIVVVGIGIPQINLVNNLTMEYFKEKYNDGFDYAYTYPGINKIIQASGRVIRTETDKGSVILIDERYKYKKYQNLFPKHWEHKKIINDSNMLKKDLEEFYK